MNHKEAYQQKLRAQLDEWKAEIDKLEAKADQFESDAKIQYYHNLEQLRAQQEIARHKLGNLQRASDDAWDDLKSGVELAWKNLGTAVESAVSRFG